MLNVDSTLGRVGVSIVDVKNVGVLDKLLSSVFGTKEPLQTCTKLTSIQFWFSNAASMPFLARNRHHKIAELQPIQSDKQSL